MNDYPIWFNDSEVIIKQKEVAYKRIEQEFSNDFHNIHTPFSLCCEVVSKLDEQHISGGKWLIIANVEFVYVVRKYFEYKQWDISNIYFVTPCDVKKKVVAKIGILEDNVGIYNYETLDVCGDFKDMKFDVIVGNPPYLRNLHLAFITQSLDLLTPTGMGRMIHPGTWLLNETPGAAKVINAINTMEPHITNLTFFSGEKVFKDAVFAMPLSITTFQRHDRGTTPIVVDDTINLVHYSADKIADITKHAGNEHYRSIKNKIISFTTKHGSLRTKRRNVGKYYAALPILVGNLDKTTGAPKSDFYNFITKSQQVVFDYRPQNDKRCFCFDTIEEANNFESFLKTFFARFCLSISKFDRSLNWITLDTTPWMDFTKQWNDEDLFTLFNITEDEKILVYKIIPPYFT